MNIQSFVDDIRNEQNGFSFGKPWRYNKSSLAAILPILRKSKEQRKYITLAEAADSVFIEDSGSISEAIVTNKGKMPVFIRAGEILKGSTQTRAVVVSRVVMPGQTARLKIVCVYASKGISSGAEFKHAGYTTYTVENTIINEAHRNDGRPDQMKVWNSVHQYSSNLSVNRDLKDEVSIGAHHEGILRGSHGTADPLDEGTTVMDSMLHDEGIVRGANFVGQSFMGGGGAGATGYARKSMDDLEGNMKEFSMTMQELFKSLPKVDWQAGAALLSFNGLQGLEVFDYADSWTAMKEELAEKEAEKLVKEDQDNAFEFNPKKAKGMVTKPLSQKFTEKTLFRDEKTETLSVELETLVGQATFLGEHMIHLNLTKKN